MGTKENLFKKTGCRLRLLRLKWTKEILKKLDFFMILDFFLGYLFFSFFQALIG